MKSIDTDSWEMPVISAMMRDPAISNLVPNNRCGDIYGLLAEAYFLHAVGPNNPSDGMDLDALQRNYSPRKVFGILVALRKAPDQYGEIKRKVDYFIRGGSVTRVTDGRD